MAANRLPYADVIANRDVFAGAWRGENGMCRAGSERLHRGCGRGNLTKPIRIRGIAVTTARPSLPSRVSELSRRNSKCRRRRDRRSCLSELLQIVAVSRSGCVRLTYRNPHQVWQNEHACCRPVQCFDRTGNCDCSDTGLNTAAASIAPMFRLWSKRQQFQRSRGSPAISKRPDPRKHRTG